ncbi:MAG: hypothetical protein R3183_07560 [Oleiphilaceae bacterium]|nr:hypothetical protein [Oleiphilaceae bacterium]
MRRNWRTLLLAVTLCSSSLGQAQTDRLSLYQLSQTVSERLELTVLFSPRVRVEQTLQLEVQQGLDDKALYALFLSVLSVHGYAAHRDNDLVTITRKYRIRSQATPVITP